MKFLLISLLTIFIFPFERIHAQIPATKVRVISEKSRHYNQNLFRRISETNLKDSTLISLLMDSQFDQFIKEGQKKIKENTIDKSQKETVLNTIVLLHSLSYEYDKIMELRNSFNSEVEDININWNEIEFFKAYPTRTEFPSSLKVKIPFTWSIAKTPMIDVFIEGKKFSFWLDIGASGSVISSSVANKIKVIKSNIINKEAGGSTESEFIIKPAIIREVEIADIFIQNLPVAILDSKDLTLAPGVTIDGIIGLPFLFQFETTIDNQNSTLEIVRNEIKSNKKRNFYWLGYPILELNLLDGLTTYWGFDTGAGTSRIKHELLGRLDSTYSISSIQIKESGVGGLSQKFQSKMIVELPVFCEDATIIFKNIKVTTPEGVGTDLINADGKIGSDIIYNSKGVRFSFKEGRFEFIK